MENEEHMARRDFLPSRETERVEWFETFVSRLRPRAALLGIAEDEVNAVEAGVAYFRYARQAQLLHAEASQTWTTHKRDVLKGNTVGSIPEPVVLPQPPPAPPTDFLAQLRDLVGRIKRHPNYTNTIGDELRIVGTGSQPVEVKSVKPSITASLAKGRPVITWTKHGYDAVELEVDRGTGSFVPLAVCIKPKYTDTTPPPPAPAVWRFRAIFRKKDETVGEWSEVASVGVFA